MQPNFTTLKIDQQENIAFLTLNRPKRLNALSTLCLKELVEAAHWFNQQKAINVVIIKGEGRTFSAGADMNDFVKDQSASESWIERRDRGQIGFRMTEAIGNMHAITIAQVHGFAIGGAFLLMLACDFRMVAEGTFFSIPEVDLGIPLSWGGIPKLVSEIGPLKTKDLVMTCRRFDANEAKGLGLINEIIKAENLTTHCLKFAQNLAKKPAVPLMMTKEQVNAVAKNIGAAYVGSAEGDMLQTVMKDPESKEAAVAYLAVITKKAK